MPPQTGVTKLASFAPRLNQFNFVAFRRVDERNRAPVAMRMWAVGQRITLGRSLFCEFFQIIHFKCKMGQVRPNHDWSTLVILQISISSSLSGALKNTSCEPRP